MSKENGYVQLRRGVFEHIRDGRMSLADYAIHSYITSQADTRTGVWMVLPAPSRESFPYPEEWPDDFSSASAKVVTSGDFRSQEGTFATRSWYTNFASQMTSTRAST